MHDPSGLKLHARQPTDVAVVRAVRAGRHHRLAPVIPGPSIVVYFVPEGAAPLLSDVSTVPERCA